LSVMAYHSFSGEVEASNTPTIRRLIPLGRHQLPRLAHKSACTSDVREVPNSRVKKIMSVAKRNRDAAEVAAIKAITACMAKKGWRVVLSPA
jgi:hypothetical protein